MSWLIVLRSVAQMRIYPGGSLTLFKQPILKVMATVWWRSQEPKKAGSCTPTVLKQMACTLKNHQRTSSVLTIPMAHVKDVKDSGV